MLDEQEKSAVPAMRCQKLAVLRVAISPEKKQIGKILCFADDVFRVHHTPGLIHPLCSWHIVFPNVSILRFRSITRTYAHITLAYYFDFLVFFLLSASSHFVAPKPPGAAALMAVPMSTSYEHMIKLFRIECNCIRCFGYHFGGVRLGSLCAHSVAKRALLLRLADIL